MKGSGRALAEACPSCLSRSRADSGGCLRTPRDFPEDLAGLIRDFWERDPISLVFRKLRDHVTVRTGGQTAKQNGRRHFGGVLKNENRMLAQARAALTPEFVSGIWVALHRTGRLARETRVDATERSSFNVCDLGGNDRQPPYFTLRKNTAEIALLLIILFKISKYFK